MWLSLRTKVRKRWTDELLWNLKAILVWFYLKKQQHILGYLTKVLIALNLSDHRPFLFFLVEQLQFHFSSEYLSVLLRACG